MNHFLFVLKVSLKPTKLNTIKLNFLFFSTGHFIRNACDLLGHCEVLAFFFIIFFFGLVLGGLEAFLFIHLQKIGAPQILMGFILLVNVVSEVSYFMHTILMF